MSKLPRLVVLSLVLSACGGGDEREHACTLIACFNGLTVTLTSPPTEAYRVEAIAAGEAAPRVVNCAGMSVCIVHFSSYFPDRVSISVITASTTSTYDKSVTYTTAFPNGPDCGACRNGPVTVP